MDLSQLMNSQRKKLSLAKQAKLIQLMGNLLNSGFHLVEVIQFLSLSHLVEAEFVSQMQEGLADGQSLAELLGQLHFSKNVVTQIALVEFHGDLAGTMHLVESHLKKQLKVKQKLIEVATYPLILLLFLVGIIWGLKNYLLPQLGQGNNMADLLIEHLPLVFFGILSSFLLLVGLVGIIFKKKTTLWKVRSLVKLPLVSQLIRLYLSAYFAREWGNLIAQGVELRQVVQLMETQKSRIFSEVGQNLTKNFQAGQTFETSVEKLEIFLPELTLMIKYGALKDKLGLELLVYADECWEQFFSKIDRLMQLIQPLVFIFVALMIVLLYAAMLLPIYSNMGVGM
ncbi:type II secretion system F family protein [Lactococcus kimchii]|nr:type II secretion system F family protein [Lactococcus sp. S-13]